MNGPKGFVKKYVVSYEDAMKLTAEKHLKARLNTAADFDNFEVEIAEENDIRGPIQLKKISAPKLAPKLA